MCANNVAESLLNCIVKGYLQEKEYQFEYDDEHNAFLFDSPENVDSVGTKVGTKYVIYVNDSSISLVGFCMVKADPTETQKMTELSRLIQTANCRQSKVFFTFDDNTGVITARSYIDCERTVPNTAVINNSVKNIEHIFRTYIPCILCILVLNTSAEQAMKLV